MAYGAAIAAVPPQIAYDCRQKIHHVILPWEPWRYHLTMASPLPYRSLPNRISTCRRR